MRFFVDTSAWIAFFNGDDEFNSDAVRFLKDEKELVTSNIVLHECAAHLENRISKRIAELFIKKILAEKICGVIYLTSEQERKTLKKYSTVPRKISFVDCSNFVVMKDIRIKEIFAFDSYFEKLGLKVVPKIKES